MDSWLARPAAATGRGRRRCPRPGARPAPGRRSLTVSGRTSRPPDPSASSTGSSDWQRGPARVAAVVDRLLGVAGLLRPAAGTHRPGEDQLLALDQPDPQRVGPQRLAGQLDPALQQPALVDDHPRLGADGHQGAQALDLLALGHQRLGGLLQHLGLPLGEVEAVGQVGHHLADRPGAAALGLLHGLDQRLQGGGARGGSARWSPR